MATIIIKKWVEWLLPLVIKVISKFEEKKIFIELLSQNLHEKLYQTWESILRSWRPHSWQIYHICHIWQICLVPYELHSVKTCFWHVRKHKAQISCVVTAQLISTFVFAQLISTYVFATYEPWREKTSPWDFWLGPTKNQAVQQQRIARTKNLGFRM